MTIAPSAKEILKRLQAAQAEEVKKVKGVTKVQLSAATSKPLNVSNPAVQKFVQAAPDGKAHRWKLKGRKVIITHSIKPEDLEKLDALAESMGIKRANLLNLLIQQALVKHAAELNK